ncbi:MAG: tyrosine-type recombinase/integrase [Legionellales bacterium]|nr:tyrosine-type recombinase/integrase [Legionellales bacterium]
MQWSWLVAQTSVRQLKRQQIEQFIEFCQNPPAAWLGRKHVARFIEYEGLRQPNPAWRPFVVRASKKALRQGLSIAAEDFQLSQSALRAIFAVLSSFFNYLIQEDAMDTNPILQLRQKSKFLRKQPTTQRVIRRLSELQWQTVLAATQQLAEQHPEQHERSLFMMTAFYAMYLRISELAATARWEPQMGHFRQDHEGCWWFFTVGKGNKERQIAVSDQMLRALKRYRQYLGLPPLPAIGETTPLMGKTRGKGGITSTRAIRQIVQQCFDHAIHRLTETGHSQEADRLLEATVHWLRHTGISDDVKTRPREHVRDDAGHSSSAITDRYIDVELRERHASAKDKLVD